jgi:putative transposase
MKKIYTVHLDPATRQALQKMQSAGVWPVRELKRARILLLADTSQAGPILSDDQIAEKVGCGRNTVQRVRQRFCNEGSKAALTEKPRPGQTRLLDSKAEQKLVAIACTTPPDGADHWSLSLLVGAVVARKLAPSISEETIRQVLLRHDLKPWLKKKVVHSHSNT